jgi:hypothetical protein
MKVHRLRTALVLAGITLLACTAKDSSPNATADTSAGVAVSPSPPSSPAGEPTANDISNYMLDMDKMRKWGNAMKAFSTLAATDSAAAEAMQAESNNEPMSQTIARIESNPVARNVLQKAGLSARDYMMITAAYLQAGMTAGLMSTNPKAKMPEGQNPKNVEFYKAHKAELERMAKEMGMDKSD